jgi:hypothetical protein
MACDGAWGYGGRAGTCEGRRRQPFIGTSPLFRSKEGGRGGLGQRGGARGALPADCGEGFGVARATGVTRGGVAAKVARGACDLGSRSTVARAEGARLPRSQRAGVLWRKSADATPFTRV